MSSYALELGSMLILGLCCFGDVLIFRVPQVMQYDYKRKALFFFLFGIVINVSYSIVVSFGIQVYQSLGSIQMIPLICSAMVLLIVATILALHAGSFDKSKEEIPE